MFIPVTTPTELRDLYPFLEEGVAAIKEKSSGGFPDIAADVYAAAMTGRVNVAVLTDGDIPWGWTAFFPSEQATGDKTLSSWMTFIRPGAPAQILEDLLTEMETVAQQMAATRIEFVTGRRAWARRLAPYGYRIGGLIIEKEVGDG